MSGTMGVLRRLKEKGLMSLDGIMGLIEFCNWLRGGIVKIEVAEDRGLNHNPDDLDSAVIASRIT